MRPHVQVIRGRIMDCFGADYICFTVNGDDVFILMFTLVNKGQVFIKIQLLSAYFNHWSWAPNFRRYICNSNSSHG